MSADDFVIFSDDKEHLQLLIPEISIFLSSRLKLTLHPDKVSIRTLASGVDFLGWVYFSDHRVLRDSTRRRMFRKIGENPSPATIAPYRGLLKHGNSRKLAKKIEL